MKYFLILYLIMMFGGCTHQDEFVVDKQLERPSLYKRFNYHKEQIKYWHTINPPQKEQEILQIDNDTLLSYGYLINDIEIVRTIKYQLINDKVAVIVFTENFWDKDQLLQYWEGSLEIYRRSGLSQKGEIIKSSHENTDIIFLTLTKDDIIYELSVAYNPINDKGFIMTRASPDKSK